MDIGVDGGLYIWIDGNLEWTYNWSTWNCQEFRKPGGFCIIQPQVLSDGTHDIRACIDANEEVDESDETNNCLMVSLSCGDDITDPADTDDPSDDPVDPAGSNCVTAGDYYKTYQSDLAQVDLGRVYLT
ncbi:MAG: CARDB domain-containing protein [Thermodesulfobacteriota bacterium]|nr:CARDB domain-containing protein [Thermodesulfobacteriota bacterium]